VVPATRPPHRPTSRPIGRSCSTSAPAPASGRTAVRACSADRTPLTATPDRPDGLLGPAAIRELAQQLDLRPTKTLGQNFLHDANTIRRIVRTAGLDGDDVVLEVGPGLGSLTLGLLAVAAHVTAVEIDPRLAAQLPVTVSARMPHLADRLTVVEADALRVTELPGPPPTALVANLPYNVAVPVLLHLLDLVPTLESALVLVQAEVADRLAAAPGSAAYGVPSVKAAWYGEVRRAGAVGRRVFWPEPNVDSGLVALVRRPPPPGDRSATFAVVDAAFAMRRKGLRAALARWAGSPAAAEQRLRAAGVDPSTRGEQLSVTDFARLAATDPVVP
jgi:16S rRNA (adenine1518-N6/adenine1519-N6)-dimethyltransferase